MDEDSVGMQLFPHLIRQVPRLFSFDPVNGILQVPVVKGPRSLCAAELNRFTATRFRDFCTRFIDETCREKRTGSMEMRSGWRALPGASGWMSFVTTDDLSPFLSLWQRVKLLAESTRALERASGDYSATMAKLYTPLPDG